MLRFVVIILNRTPKNGCVHIGEIIYGMYFLPHKVTPIHQLSEYVRLVRWYEKFMFGNLLTGPWFTSQHLVRQLTERIYCSETQFAYMYQRQLPES